MKPDEEAADIKEKTGEVDRKQEEYSGRELQKPAGEAPGDTESEDTFADRRFFDAAMEGFCPRL